MFDLVARIIARHLQNHASDRRVRRVWRPLLGNPEVIVLDWHGTCARGVPATWNWCGDVDDVVDNHIAGELDTADELESCNSAPDPPLPAGVVDLESWPGCLGWRTCLFASGDDRKMAPCCQWMETVGVHGDEDFAVVETCRMGVLGDPAGVVSEVVGEG